MLRNPCPTAKVELSPHCHGDLLLRMYIRAYVHTHSTDPDIHIPTLDRDGDTEGRLLPECSPRGCTAAGRYVTDVALSTSRCLSLPGIFVVRIA